MVKALPYQTDHPDTRILPTTLDATTSEVPTLEVSVPAFAGAEYDLVLDIASGFDRVVGRDASAGIPVPDPTISRQHARITHDRDGVWLEDLGSTNGTYLNGRRLLERCRLHDGDEVKIGSAVAVFHDVIGAADSTDQLPVVDPTGGPARSTRPGGAEIETPGAACPRCSVAPGRTTWFCHRCGYQQSPIAIQPPGPSPSGAQSIRQGLIGPHGRTRPWSFRQVMRARNGGRRPLYNETMSVPALVLRALALTLLIVAVVAALVVLGLGGHHFVQVLEQPAGRSVVGHSHSFVPVRFHSRMR